VASAAKRSPDATALTMGSERLTYAELNQRADRLSGYLVSLGVGPEVAAGICLERSFDYIVGALAVWKAGGAYLPVDPKWPEERRAFVLEDAQARVLITRGTTAGATWIVDLDRDADKIARAAPPSLPKTKPEDLAYIIYTSGSTGGPKGVEVTHANLLNLSSWHRRSFGVSAKDRASHIAGLAFDAAVWEIWPYLSAGASIALPDETTRVSSELLREWLTAERVTISFVPTALAEPMIQSPWPRQTALRYLLTGADTLHQFPSPGLPFQLVNNYGPTECTVVATSGIVSPASTTGGKPAIGKAIANARIYLLNENLQPVAAGETGEIFIGGAGVARGYRNRPGLTAERFLADPFSTAAGSRMYRTGDLGAWLPDGQIAFQGRVDNQEKIRGHRIEPDEIVSVLMRHAGVSSAAVAACGPASNPQLAAYIVPAAGPVPRSCELREFLSRELPEYMIPSQFVRLTALPLTSNGKLDRTALPIPAPENALDTIPYTAPESPVEIQVVSILSQLLALDRVGREDNFFLLGGHSLLGAQLIVRIRERFGVHLTLRDLFVTQTVAKLAERIEREVIAALDSMSENEASRILSILEHR
jgi:amino acid adenylation domain-containing protein